MPSQIGITTNPGERKRHWQAQHPTLKNWEILERHKSRVQAQVAAQLLTLTYRCIPHATGNPTSRGEDWVIYKFDY